MEFTRNRNPKTILTIGNRFRRDFPTYIELLENSGWKPITEGDLKRKNMNYYVSFKLPKTPGHLVLYRNHYINEGNTFYGKFLGTYVDEKKECWPSEVLTIAKQMDQYYKGLLAF